MKFISTRGKAPALEFSEAMSAGLAADGGLYVPEKFPRFNAADFKSGLSLASVAEKVLTLFFDEKFKKFVPEICKNAFDFPLPLNELDSDTSILELYHGATSAFKDFGARFLAECLRVIGDKKNYTVLVATSGDTGAAVAGAFFKKNNIDVNILFPKGMVSPFQEKQLTGWGENIHAFAVRGTFDDCQRLVKEAFLDSRWKKKNLIGANSINVGRILPQAAYYAWAALEYSHRSNDRRASFIIPAGNLGNAVAAFWAKQMGFPISKIVLACNANRSVVDYFESEKWAPKPTIRTLANAMDVGNASNMERLINLYPSLAELHHDATAVTVSDDEIKEAIKFAKNKWKKIVCPHTATAIHARQPLKGDWIIVATAHPAKFQSIVEPLIGEKIQMPANLASFEKAEEIFEEIEPSLNDLAVKML